MADRLDLTCHACGYLGIADGSDGFFYCLRCGSRAEDIIVTAVAEEDLVHKGDAGGGGGIYLASHRRQRAIKTEPLPQVPSKSQFWESLKALDDDVSDRVKKEDGEVGGGVGPTGPSDFGVRLRSMSYEDYYSELRMRYVMGVQIMIELQCKALVEKFQVSSLICGLAGTIWLRFVAFTRVFDDNWADEAIRESESQKQGLLDDFKPCARYSGEPHNIHGQRAVTIWYRSLSKIIPLSHSLAICFLVCHLAREAVLPTDIFKWSLEGKLPYFAAFVEIEKQMGSSSYACPLSSSYMFRPTETVNLHKLESHAASIAKIIGLELPPVNFYAIASRYLTKLSLPVEKILPSVSQIYEWSFPPELWLSTDESGLPTRVGVMSMVIVAIRILYNLNGFGFWEASLSRPSGSSGNGQEEPKCNLDVKDDAGQGFPSRCLDGWIADSSEKSSDEKSEMDAAKLLRSLEIRYNELEERYEYSNDLPTYLKYCREVVFAGLEPAFEDFGEQKIIEELWDFYQNQKEVGSNGVFHQKRSRDEVMSSANAGKKIRENRSTSTKGDKDGGVVRRMKANMEENRFCYIPPRVNVKRLDYLHYVRKKDAGSYSYAVHADYYILLRSCARVALVDIKVMHTGVLSFERRLDWLEKRIDHCLHLRLPPNDHSCQFCREDMTKDSAEDLEKET
ncbi:hypothetical protein U1Q18_031464 [Sarracenia purpurea var. burkii]